MKAVNFIWRQVRGSFERSSGISLFFSGMSGLLVTVIFYQSYFGYNPPPVEIINTAARAVVGEYSTTVWYSRTVIVKTPIANEVSRTVRCGDAGVIYDLPTTARNYTDVEVRYPSHQFTMPYRVAPGTICRLSTVSRYQPTFSLRDHSYPVPDLVFIVESEK